MKPVELEQIPQTDWIFFSSKSAVKSFFASNLIIPEGTKFGVIGKATAEVVRKYQCRLYWRGNQRRPPHSFRDQIGDAQVLFPISDISMRTVQDALPQDQVFEVTAYTTKLKTENEIDRADVVVFTSPSNVDAYFGTERYRRPATTL